MKAMPIAGALLVLAGAAMPALSADAVRPGKWEFTSRLETATPPELPKGVSLPAGVKLPSGGIAVTHTQCLDTAKSVPNDPRSGCKIDRIQHNGSVINWWTTCHTGQGTATAVGSARYSGDTMAATMNTRAPNGSGGFIETTQHITGHYLGACTK